MAVRKNSTDSNQLGMFMPESNWKVPSMSDLPEFWRADETGFDTETRDPNLMTHGPGWYRNDGEIVGFSLSCDAQQGFYLPIAHEGGDNMPRDNVLEYFRYGFKKMGRDNTLVLMNGMYDLGWSSVYGIVPGDECQIIDIMWVQALLNEHLTSYALKAITKYWGLEGKDEKLLEQAAHAFGVDPKGGIWRLPARYAAPYAEQDAVATLQSWHKQKPHVAEQGLSTVVKLEHDLIPLLLHMRRQGVRIDMDQAERVRDDLQVREKDAISKVKHLSGCDVDIFAAESVAKAFRQMDIPYETTATGKPSFRRNWLETHESELAQTITEARQLNKVWSGFVVDNILGKCHDGRIHCEFHPLRSDDGGTVSGRFSCSNPNLQQIPARHPELGPMVRSLFLPEEGEQWCSIDYSQQEPRLTIHYAAKGDFTGGREAAQAYLDNPNTDYHDFVSTMMFGPGFTKQQRYASKQINLGMAYNMGGAKLCRSLGFSTEWVNIGGEQVEVAGPEGKEFISKYHAKMPFIKELNNHFQGEANQAGFLRTLSHRRCRFDNWEPIRRSGSGLMKPYEEAVRMYGRGNIRRAEMHKALNKKIQGGAADMIKVALRDLWRAGIKPLLTIHDENDFSMPNTQVAQDAAEIMRNCMRLEVPMKVDIDYGRSWGEAVEMKEVAA